jgi:hypothetical protein
LFRPEFSPDNPTSSPHARRLLFGLPGPWNYAIGFVLIAAGAFFVFRGPL